MKALRFHRVGNPEVLVYEDAPAPAVRPRHVLVKVKAAGLNFADTLFIRGQYFVRPTLPDIPGLEAAGEVLEAGEGVTRFKPGDRVMVVGMRTFAEVTIAREGAVYAMDPGIDFERAAALPIQGLTAHHMLFHVGRLAAGERVLVHAAAGGVGALAIQLAKQRGAVVVASCSPEKHAFARELGADHVLDSRGDVLRDLKTAVGEVDLVLEMVGGTEQYKKNLAALAPYGRMIVYGAASGDTRGQIEPIGLMGKNATISGYYLTPILDRRELCEGPLDEMAKDAANGKLRIEIGGRYSLAEGARAFEAIEGRGSRGKLLLIP